MSNQKKYRLKKWYPSLPEDWKAGDTVERKHGGIYSYKNSNEDRTSQYIRRNHVKDNPEFWEPVSVTTTTVVAEKEGYQILSFIDFYGNIWIRVQDGNFTRYESRKKGTFPEKYMLQPDNDFSIYSVERISDKEVFTLGDKVIGGIDDTLFEIDMFERNNRWNGELAVHSKKEIGTASSIVKVKHYEEPEKPLFTTKDGVDIYEGDPYWIVDENGYVPHQPTAGELSGTKIKYTYFSTRKKAEEYKENTKPVYSKNDIRTVIDDNIQTVYEHVHGVKMIEVKTLKQKLGIK